MEVRARFASTVDQPDQNGMIACVGYSFRNTVRLSATCQLAGDAATYTLSRPDELSTVRLSTTDGNTPIAGATALLLIGGSYATVEEATASAQAWRQHLVVGFANARVGLDIGIVNDPIIAEPSSVPAPLTPAQSPWGRLVSCLVRRNTSTAPSRLLRGKPRARVLRGKEGLLVFESDPSPTFITYSADATISKSIESVIASVGSSRSAEQTVSPKQALAYDLVHSSYFAHSPETRFILLVTAIEAVLTKDERSAAVVGVVEELKTSLAGTTGLSTKEQDQLRGVLQKAKEESIGDAGRKMALALGERRFDAKKPEKFFVDIYNARSDLVHGNIPRPDTAAVSRLLPTVETFVIDLLHTNLALSQ